MTKRGYIVKAVEGADDEERHHGRTTKAERGESCSPNHRSGEVMGAILGKVAVGNNGGGNQSNLPDPELGFCAI